MSNRTTGTTLITAAAGVFLYGIYVVAGTGWTCLIGAFFLYVAGFNLRNRDRGAAAAQRFEEAHERVSTSIAEARNRRGMN